MSRSLDRLLEVMARLRDPQRGCPWDREQNFSTITPYTIEEAYEVADAIARGDHNLGFAYASLPTGDRGDNLRRAIACYEAALRVLAESEFPQDWAMAQNNLGNACASLPAGDHGDNLRRAIACYKAALRVRTESGSPLDWAETQNNLGTAYVDLPTGDRHKNLERAIDCFEAALRVRTERDFPQYWRRPKSISASPMRICLLATATKI